MQIFIALVNEATSQHGIKYCHIMQSRYPPNETWLWCPMDTEARYQLNRAERADDLHRHGWWDHDPFDYHFNSAGFRSAEFDHGPGTLYLGCSYTLGIGLPYADTWARRVSDTLGTACWNLAQGGGSMDTCFRLAEHWIPRLKPTRVMLMSTVPARMELIDAGGVPRLYSVHGASPGAREWLEHDENIRLNYLKNKWAIQQICNQEHIPFHEWPMECLGEVKTSLGRDLIHPGKTAHKMFAERVLREIDAHGVD
jgi:hypothetical protein